MELEPIIGLEIHVQLKTKSKMFCGCDNAGENQPPNTTICEVCTGQPGTLPVLNERAVVLGLRIALALNCRLPGQSVFSRKNYFYPDLPKGYQISQFDQPLAQNGQFTYPDDTGAATVGIARVHLEEDSAKLTHSAGRNQSLVDFNRAGTPLVEIVTLPDFRSARAAKAFLQELRLMLRHLNVSDADMEKGHMRCDANVSLRPAGDLAYHTKTEIKNLNSFKSVERALSFEIARQSRLWSDGTPPDRHATRGWDDLRNETIEQRAKEGEADYRYFPEPDLPPLQITAAEIEQVKAGMPELPGQLRVRLASTYALSPQDIESLIADRALLEYYEEVMSELEAWWQSERPTGSADNIEAQRGRLAKLAANWLIHKVLKLSKDRQIEIGQVKINPENLAEFIALLDTRKLHSANASEVLSIMFDTGRDPSGILEEKSLHDAGTLEDLDIVIDRVLREHTEQVAQYRSGKLAVMQFFIGQVMRVTQGKASPDIIKDSLIRKLT